MLPAALAGRKKKASGAGTKKQPASGSTAKTAAFPAELATTLPPQLSRLSASAPPFTPCMAPDAPGVSESADGPLPGASTTQLEADTAQEATGAALRPQAAERQGNHLHSATAGQGVLQPAVAAAPAAPSGDTEASGAAPAAGTSGDSAGGHNNGGSAESSRSLPPPPGGPCAPDSNGSGSTHDERGNEHRGERQTAPLPPDAGTSPSAGTPFPGPGDGSNGHVNDSADGGLEAHGRWDVDRSGAPNGGGLMRDDADVGDGGGMGLTAPLLPGGSGDAGADDAPMEKGLGSEGADDKRAPWAVTVATLLSLSLGWGLWLMPQGFARLGWLPAVRLVAYNFRDAFASFSAVTYCLCASVPFCAVSMRLYKIVHTLQALCLTNMLWASIAADLAACQCCACLSSLYISSQFMYAASEQLSVPGFTR